MAFFAGFAALAIDPFFPSFGNNGIDVQHYDLQIAIGDDPNVLSARAVLSHQWFGNSVSVAKWEDIWLSEGFATYGELLWVNRDDPDGFKADMEAIYAKLLAKHVGSAVVDTPLDLFSDRTYRRGALALYAVELQIGTRKLTHLLKRWVTKYRYQSVDSQDFIELAVRDSGDDAVRAILEAWLYDDAMPALPGLDPDEIALNTAARSALVRAPLAMDLRREH